METPWVYSDRRYASTDMQYDLLRLTYSSFDASWQEEHDAGKMNIIPLLSPKLLPKNFFFVKTAVFSYCSLEDKPLILGQIWGHVDEKTFEEPSNALFRDAIALLVLELCAHL